MSWAGSSHAARTASWFLALRKEGGKIYATEVSGIMDLIKKVQDSGSHSEAAGSLGMGLAARKLPWTDCTQ